MCWLSLCIRAWPSLDHCIQACARTLRAHVDRVWWSSIVCGCAALVTSDWCALGPSPWRAMHRLRWTFALTGMVSRTSPCTVTCSWATGVGGAAVLRRAVVVHVIHISALAVWTLSVFVHAMHAHRQRRHALGSAGTTSSSAAVSAASAGQPSRVSD